MSQDQANALGRQLPDIWNVDSQKAPPDYGLNFALGGSRRCIDDSS